MVYFYDPHELQEDVDGHGALVGAAVQVPLQHAQAGGQRRGPGRAVGQHCAARQLTHKEQLHGVQGHRPPLHGGEELLHALAHQLRGQGAAELSKGRRHALGGSGERVSTRGEAERGTASRHQPPSSLPSTDLEGECLDAAQPRPVGGRLHESVQRGKQAQAVLLEGRLGHGGRRLQLVLAPGYADEADKEGETAHDALHLLKGFAGRADVPIAFRVAAPNGVQYAVEVAKDGRVEALRWGKRGRAMRAGARVRCK